jgi:uncharacterized metal-binding protein
VPGCVDKCADRDVQRNADQPADRQHGADLCLVPLGLGKQENTDVGPEPATNIGQEEVQPVERRAIRHGGRLAVVSRFTS